MADLKQLARLIFRETLAAIDIPETMRRKMARDGPLIHCSGVAVDLRQASAVKVVAIGKASHALLQGLASVLEPDIPFQGIVSAPVAPVNPHPSMRYFTGGHPVPNQASLAAAEATLELLSHCDARSLVIFLLSGGGSALAEKLLLPGATLEDVRGLHQALVTCGAPIDPINTVRKHLSAVKGGRLAAAAPAAMKLTFAVSDVPAGRESALASGPTIPDPGTRADAERVILEYGLGAKIPPRIRDWLADNHMPETPKAGDAAFARSLFHLLLGLDDLFHPAHTAAAAAGFTPVCDNSSDDWPVRRAADHLLGELARLQGQNPGRCVAVLADGEVSSPVTGNGIGGRNSAFVLACVEKIAGKRIAVLSAGTDGIDGNSPAAGAVADGDTLARARERGMDPEAFFRQSDAYGFFSRLGDDVTTGPTGNNLRDLRILLAEP